MLGRCSLGPPLPASGGTAAPAVPGLPLPSPASVLRCPCLQASWGRALVAASQGSSLLASASVAGACSPPCSPSSCVLLRHPASVPQRPRGARAASRSPPPAASRRPPTLLRQRRCRRAAAPAATAASSLRPACDGAAPGTATSSCEQRGLAWCLQCRQIRTGSASPLSALRSPLSICSDSFGCHHMLQPRCAFRMSRRAYEAWLAVEQAAAAAASAAAERNAPTAGERQAAAPLQQDAAAAEEEQAESGSGEAAPAEASAHLDEAGGEDGEAEAPAGPVDGDAVAEAVEPVPAAAAVAAAAAPAKAAAAVEAGNSVDRLAAAVDRLAAAIELLARVGSGGAH